MEISELRKTVWELSKWGDGKGKEVKRQGVKKDPTD